MTANDQRSAHWSKVREAKSTVGYAVRQFAHKDGLPKGLPRSHVQVLWFAPDGRRRDADSLGPFLKAALDGLVAYGCWPDDDSRHIHSTSTSVEVDRENPRIEIRVFATGSKATA